MVIYSVSFLSFVRITLKISAVDIVLPTVIWRKSLLLIFY